MKCVCGEFANVWEGNKKECTGCYLKRIARKQQMNLEGKRAICGQRCARDKEANSQRGRATTGTGRSKATKTMGNVKFVFDFEEGDGKNKQLLGGKGSGLVEMTQIGLPIPFGFVITTEACRQYYAKSKSFQMVSWLK